MSIFIGNIEGKIDEKGRLFIPSMYRKQLEGDDTQSIVMRKDPDRKCLVVYPRSVWERKIEELKDSLNEWNADDQMLMMQFVSDAVCVDIDSHGRVLIPRKYIDEIGLKTEALFVGSVDRFTLWSKQEFESQRLSPIDFAERLRDKMSKKNITNNAD